MAFLVSVVAARKPEYCSELLPMRFRRVGYKSPFTFHYVPLRIKKCWSLIMPSEKHERCTSPPIQRHHVEDVHEANFSDYIVPGLKTIEVSQLRRERRTAREERTARYSRVIKQWNNLFSGVPCSERAPYPCKVYRNGHQEV
ncbi:hypothetical protein ALC53_06313 [Atta colombica]|uniref:Uncharacterized protein n=1 Tax=Atta colombica TaxID=520822 RepID=A0A195BEP7_9HYME|nr:hypothetical protein ALC53_06313 [Atta colombica]